MKLSAYETTLLKSRKIDKLLSDARTKIIVGEAVLVDSNNDGEVYAIIGKSDIEPFNYPLLLEMPSRSPIALVDLRLHARGIKHHPTSVEVLKFTTADMLVNSALLALKWRFGNSTQVLTFNPIPMIVFTQWITESITRKLGLAADVQVYLTILFATFYHNLNKTKAMSKDEQERLAILLARNFRINVEQFNQVLERTEEGDFEDLTNLMKFIQRDRMNVRLEKLQIKDIYMLLNSSWFGGPNAREQVDVALEYPPIFIPMVHEAVMNRSYNKTSLSQIYQRYQRNYTPDDFHRDFLRLVRN